MKARELKQILNTTYIVHGRADYIAISSPYADIITVNRLTLKIKYWAGSKEDLERSPKTIPKFEILNIWNKLEELRDSGALRALVDGNDEIPNPLTVYSVEGTKIARHETDYYGWPNVTAEGILMYDNEFTPDYGRAVKMAAEEANEYIGLLNEQIAEAKKGMEEKYKKLKRYEDFLFELLKKQRHE